MIKFYNSLVFDGNGDYYIEKNFIDNKKELLFVSGVMGYIY